MPPQHVDCVMNSSDALREVRSSKPESDLGREMWAMVAENQRHISFGCIYDEAYQLAQKNGGIVMTDDAASRFRFNELRGVAPTQ